LASEGLSVGFLRRGATQAILKSEGTQPVVRDELMREVRNGTSPEMVWGREEGMGLSRQVVGRHFII
jgi:hypothetical protein